jgi:hypothetical protein
MQDIQDQSADIAEPRGASSSSKARDVIPANARMITIRLVFPARIRALTRQETYRHYGLSVAREAEAQEKFYCLLEKQFKLTFAEAPGIPEDR